jgi:hypothetical protein
MLFIMPASPISELSVPLAIVCHDAGGANQIIAMLDENIVQRTDLRVYVEGPAAKVWQHRFPSKRIENTLTSVLQGAHILISGTSWQSDLEHQARQLAQQQRIYSVALLDHWVNYRERFMRIDKTVLPDQLWVTDEHAERLARLKIPELSLRRVHDFYMQHQLTQIQGTISPTVPEILFLCEPAMSNWGKSIPGEFQALDFFIACLPDLPIPQQAGIILRPHPSESTEKYLSWAQGKKAQRISIDTSVELGNAIGRAKWVVGCQSYAMTVALRANRSVYCALPPWATPCVLPHPEIIRLKDLYKG